MRVRAVRRVDQRSEAHKKYGQTNLYVSLHSNICTLSRRRSLLPVASVGETSPLPSLTRIVSEIACSPQTYDLLPGEGVHLSLFLIIPECAVWNSSRGSMTRKIG